MTAMKTVITVIITQEQAAAPGGLRRAIHCRASVAVAAQENVKAQNAGLNRSRRNRGSIRTCTTKYKS